MVAVGTGLGIEFNTTHMRFAWGTYYDEPETEIRGIPDAEINWQWHFKL